MKINRISDFKKTNGTSFSGLTFEATTNQIIDAVGEPDYRGGADDKVTRDWSLELEDGTIFTIYDWKEYCDFDDDEAVYWHIGTKWDDKEAADKVEKALVEIGLML